MINRYTPNNTDGDIVIRIGEVISLDDKYHGGRIKVKLEQDKQLQVNEIPFCYPLLPKTVQSIPKVGEAVFVITSRANNANSIRYYLGPILSQPQYFYNEQYNGGDGTSTAMIDGSTIKPLPSIDVYKGETQGAYPNANDVALVGRKSEDVILKDGEVLLRCGIRDEKAINNDSELDKGLQGYVVFNTQDPAYIQLKYKRGVRALNNNMNSVINIVADKINLISHDDPNHFDLTNNQELIHPDDLSTIMSQLHQIPYGDKVVDALRLISQAILTHVHSFPLKTPCNDGAIKMLGGKTFDDILSPNVRIS